MIGGSWAGLPPGVSNRISSLYTTQSSFDRAGYWSIRTMADWFTRLAGDKKNFISDNFRIIIDKKEKNSSTNYLINTKVDWREELDGKLLTSQAYIHDQKVLLGICESLNLRCVVILQPVLSLRNKPIGDIEQNNFEAQEKSGTNQATRRFYREVKSELIRIKSNNYKLIDLSDLPNSNKYSDLPFFYDFGHTGFYSGEIIGREISNEIERLKIFK
jgi:Fe-S cluster assembly iron-binding protein IscA